MFTGSGGSAHSPAPHPMSPDAQELGGGREPAGAQVLRQGHTWHIQGGRGAWSRESEVGVRETGLRGNGGGADHI